MITAVPQPPQRYGPFTVVATIGAGSMGIVYDAVHSDSGERVALKTVSLPRRDYLSSIRREIHTLRGLQHPGIVRILAEGVSGGVPWYAMERLEGRTLRGWIERWSFPPALLAATSQPDDQMPSLRSMLTLMRRVSVALSFLHGEGIVHGDLKPENIFLRRDGRPVLVDFGLAWRFPSQAGREVLDGLSGSSGTPSYMAPEQIRGGPIDARADLYGLGCVLFELLTGRPPFVAGRPAQVLLQHLSAPPPPVSSLMPQIPDGLDALLASLLAKQPRARVGQAGDVVRSLEQLGAEPDDDEIKRRPVPYLYSPLLAGRDAVLHELLSAGERARQGVGACILIGGESGVGKTYLAAEAARRTASDVRVVVGDCAPVCGAPFHPLRGLLQAIADHCVEHGRDAADRLLGARGKVLATYEPQLAELPGQDRFPQPPDLTGPAARDHVFACMAETITAFATEQPLLLVIDDLHWADELTLRFLQTLPEDWFQQRPVLLLATHRSEETPAMLRMLLARNSVRCVEIGGLDESTVNDLVREMLAVEEVPGAFGRFLSRQSQGNPFYVAEYLRNGIAEGIVRRVAPARLEVGADGAPDDAMLAQLPLPRSLRDLVAQRILGLSTFARRAVDVGAVLGREFDGEALQQAVALDDTESMEAIAELLARQVIEQVAPGRFRFVHDKLNEIAYERIDAERRRALHMRVARVLEQQPRDASLPRLARLAHHWSKAERFDEELPYAGRAGMVALGAFAFAEATTHLRRAVALVDRGVVPASGPVTRLIRARWEHGIARAEEALGGSASDAYATHALQTLGYRVPASERGWLLLLAGQVVVQLTHAAGLTVRRGANVEELSEAALVAEFLTQRYFFLDNAPALLACGVLGANLAERAGGGVHVPRSYICIGMLAGFVRLQRVAEHYFAKAEEVMGGGADASERVYRLCTMSVHYSNLGDWQRAEAVARQALAQLAAVRDPFTRELVLTIIGHVEYFTGRLESARQWYEQLLAVAQQRANPQTVNWGLFSIARSDVALGRFAEALPLLDAARHGLEQRPELQAEILCHGLLAITHLRMGQLEEARQYADGTAARIARARSMGFPVVDAYVNALEVYHAQMAAGRLPAQPQRAVRRLRRSLRLFARMLPMALPARCYVDAQFALLHGRRRRARRLFARSLHTAQGFCMPREIALAVLGLARTAPAASAQRRKHLEDARRCFAAMGCQIDLQVFDQQGGDA